MLVTKPKAVLCSSLFLAKHTDQTFALPSDASATISETGFIDGSSVPKYLREGCIPIPEILKKLIPLEYFPGFWRVNDMEIDPNLPTIILIIGPSGAGKDRSAELLDKHYAVRTATTREQRTDDPNDTDTKYHWYRKLFRNFNPTDPSNKELTQIEMEIYLAELPEDLKLVEYDLHHGSIYGLPLFSIKEALKKGFGYVITEMNAVPVIKEKFSRFNKNALIPANIVTIMVIPDNYDQLFEAALSRGDTDDRFIHGRNTLQNVFKLADFVFHNSRVKEIYSNNDGREIFKDFVEMIKGLALMRGENEGRSN